MQERLAGQSRRKRGVESAGSSPALLVDRAFDGDGNRLTPTYAVKGSRRYRYYVSAPLVRGEPCPNGIRVPAPDLERLVVEEIASHLGNGLWIAEQLGSGLDAGPTQRLVHAAGKLAARLGGDITELKHVADRQHYADGEHAANGEHTKPTELLRELIARVVAGGKQVAITLGRTALLSRLVELDGTLASPYPSEANRTFVEIGIEARALHCGKQVRMVLGDVQGSPRSPDPALINLLADARRWFEDLRTGGAASIAELVERDGEQVSHVSRTIGLAFLAPDIVETILSGQQPISLTPERLKPRGPPARLGSAAAAPARLNGGSYQQFESPLPPPLSSL